MSSYQTQASEVLRDDHIKSDSKGGFPLSRNFYVRADVNFNWLYVRKLK